VLVAYKTKSMNQLINIEDSETRVPINICYVLIKQYRESLIVLMTINCNEDSKM